MPRSLILASASAVRLRLLLAAGLDVQAYPARIDEDAVRAALAVEGATARDTADTLAEMKARQVSAKHPAALVLGCDQVLALKEKIFCKPESPDQVLAQLRELRGKTHLLLSALVLYDQQQPVWRHVGAARMTMSDFSDAYLEQYVERNWASIQTSVGGYKLEEEGVRLFSAIEGDYFTILGLPLLPLIGYLGKKGYAMI